MANTADFAPDILPQSPDQINSVLNQTTPAAPGGPVKGGLRSVLSGILQNFSYGAGQAMKKQAGLPTDEEMAQNNARLAFTNAQTRLTQNEAANQELQRQIAQRKLNAMMNMSKGEDPFSSLGQLSPDEQALVGVARQESQINGDVKPIHDAIKQIVQNRSVFGRTTRSDVIVTPEMVQQTPALAPFLGKPINPTQAASFGRADIFQNVPTMTDQGPIVIDRKTATAKPVTGPGGQQYGPTSLASPYQVGDPNNPGQTVVVKAGQSYGMPGTQSASVQVPRRAAVAEVPTNIGNQKVAFSTAIQHADLLRQAARALNNGDQQQLNELQNKFGNAFGMAGPITAQAIADAYGREVTSVLSKGHMTDSEIATVGKTINPMAQNFQQIDSVLGAYQNLAQSKMNMLDQQTQSAVTKSQVPRQVRQQMEQSGASLPQSAASQLKEGQHTTFGNGQTWTLQGGKPVRVK